VIYNTKNVTFVPGLPYIHIVQLAVSLKFVNKNKNLLIKKSINFRFITITSENTIENTVGKKFLIKNIFALFILLHDIWEIIQSIFF